MKLWLARQRYLIDFTLASLARRKTRNLGLLFVYTLLVFMLASVTLYTHALRQEAARVLAASPEVIVQRMVAGRHDLIPPGYLEKIGRIRGVQKIEGRLWGYYYDAVTKANYTFMVPAEDAPRRRSSSARRWSARAGWRRTTAFPSAPIPASCTASSSPRAAAGLGTGQRRPGADERGKLPRLLRLSGRPLHRHRAVGRQPAGGAQRRAEAGRRPARRAAHPARGGAAHLCLDLRLARGHRAGAALGAILAFGILAWEKASGLSAEEKREIGILKAIGWETGDVIKMKFWEGLLISLTAFLLGFVAAYIHVFHFAASLFEPVLKGWAVLYPRFQLTPADRRPAGGDAVLLHRGALRGGGAGADLEGGDHRPRFGDARLR
jgi:lipoprotein-releasing system permease protein